jgi:hypothetical protein
MVKLSLCLINEALLHENVRMDGCIDSCFLTSALVGGEWPASRPFRFTSRKRILRYLLDRLGGARTGLDAKRKRIFLTLSGLELRPLGRPSRSKSRYRLLSYMTIPIFLSFFISGGGGCGSVVGLAAIVKARMSLVRFPMSLLGFSIDLIPSAWLWPFGRRPARKADSLTAMCEPIVWICWIHDVSQPCGPPRTVTRITLPTFLHPCYAYESLHCTI